MCVCLQEPQVLEAQTRRGRAVMEGQVPREVRHVWWSSRLLRVKIKSYQISVGLFVLLTEKFYSFEHFFFSWNESLAAFAEGHDQTFALPPHRERVILEHCVASCCYFCLLLENQFSQKHILSFQWCGL